MDARERLRSLLPQPKRLTPGAGRCPLGRDIQMECDVPDGRIERGYARWVDTVTGAARGDSPTTHPVDRCGSAAITLRVRCEPGPSSASDYQQGYRIDIGQDQIDVGARSAVGCWYALQTLRRLTPRPGDSDVALPVCTIEDWPDFETRGLLLDITRGRVPTVERLEALVDRFASLKINQLQLYIEHAFVFSFDRDICDADSGLTPEEVVELDAYCRERFIDLVPAVATLGHMGRILSLPRYRHLAEIEPNASWESMDWPARVRGLTLDCTNPEAHRLVERIWSDILDAFSCRVVNICGDEPWDLARGRNAGRWTDRERGRAYLDHIRRTHDYCVSRRRSTMFWSDVAATYPDLFDRVPSESTVLHWGYDDRADYEGAGSFVDVGFRTCVCPGTSGWKRIINAMNLAERNIAAFARAGRQYGATGLINTDWGDHGHFNMPACSWHAIALGAALGWSADHETGSSFDEAFARAEWGLNDGALVSALRGASAIAAACETWRIMWMPIERVAGETNLPFMDAISAMQERARCAEQLARELLRVPGVDADVLKELALACRFSALCATKLLFCQSHRGQPIAAGADSIQAHRRLSRKTLADEPPVAPVARQLASLRSTRGAVTLRAWVEELTACAGEYAEHWRMGNKEPGLQDILSALNAAAGDVDRAVHI